jgi:hypothetical protein
VGNTGKIECIKNNHLQLVNKSAKELKNWELMLGGQNGRIGLWHALTSNWRSNRPLSPEAVTSAMGISPRQVPTYLSLTAASKTRALYHRQAVDLIKLYENLDYIFKNLANVASERIRQKLQENEGGNP